MAHWVTPGYGPHATSAVVSNTLVNSEKQMGGCQNYGALMGALSIRCRIIIGIQKGP